MCNAEIADTVLFFPFAQCHQLRVHIDEIMHLHQIDSLRAQERQRAFHRIDSASFAARPNFRCQKNFFSDSERGGKLADHRFSPAVHRR